MTHWYFALDGHREGPVSAEFVASELRRGRLTPADLVWTEGQDAWRPISEFPELTTYTPPPPLPPAAPEFAAPEAGAAVPPASLPKAQNPFARLQLRLLATLLDQLLLTFPGVLLGLMVVGAMYATTEGFDLQNPDHFERLQGFISLIGLIANWLYCAGFEASRHQATPGMMVVGLRVATVNGERLPFVQATIRHFLRALTWMFGWVPAISLPTRQMLHDIVTNTIVTEGHPRPIHDAPNEDRML